MNELQSNTPEHTPFKLNRRDKIALAIASIATAVLVPGALHSAGSSETTKCGEASISSDMVQGMTEAMQMAGMTENEIGADSVTMAQAVGDQYEHVSHDKGLLNDGESVKVCGTPDNITSVTVTNAAGLSVPIKF